jgi:AcrR family transcriptional regulator
MKISPASSPKTADRIIAAAGIVFAERGFRATTIRQITARAGVNVAAVNYHFQNKSELYVRVLREAKRHLALIPVEDLPGTPEDQLRGFIQQFVRYLLDPQRPLWHGRVLAMEMSNPTPALGVVIRELTAPFYRRVRVLIGEVVKGSASPAELDLFTVSVLGQCIFYVSSRPCVEQLAVDLGRTPDRIGRIADHVSAFSLAALKDFRQRGHAKSPRVSRLRPRHASLL